MAPSRPLFWSLVQEVLQTGSNDGQQILDHAQTSNVWQALYLASKSSPYAEIWREAFGQYKNSEGSILEVAVKLITDYADSQAPDPDHETSSAILKLIANCCADNNHNRSQVIHAGVLLPLLKLLIEGEDPNVLVPTIYNVCSDMDEPASNVSPDVTSDQQIRITLAEERLARADVSSSSVYTGLFALLSSHVVLDCQNEIKEYLSELVEMAARPAITSTKATAIQDDLNRALECFFAPQGGVLLADYSAKCRSHVVRALFSIAASETAQTFLASSGAIFRFALLADTEDLMPGYYGEDEEEQKENQQAIEDLQTAMLKLVYEVCQMPAFADPPKYGLARQALDVLCHHVNLSSFKGSIAYIMLYGFINSDARAYLLATEELLPALLHTLRYETDRTIVHPALAVASKIAVSYSLRKHLHAMHYMQAVQHLLTRNNLGYEIPLNAVTFLELMIKGRPEYVRTLVETSQHHDAILSDLFKLFDKGHDAICFEIGRLIIELCATMAQQDSAQNQYFNLDAMFQLFGTDQWAKVLTYMATKGQAADPAVAQRAWFALGLLSTLNSGREALLQVLQNDEVQQRLQAIDTQSDNNRLPSEPYVNQNMRFMMHNMRQSSELTAAVNQLSLG